MKKIIHGLLVGLLATSAIEAGVNSNRTYIAARSTLSHNMALGMMARNGVKKKAPIGADISITGIFRQSHNSDDLAKYFGGGAATNSNQTGKIEVAKNSTDTSTNALWGYDIDAVVPTDKSKAASGTISFDPKRTVYGAHICYNHDLNKFVDGLFFQFDVPIVSVTNDLNMTVSKGAANTTAANGTNHTVNDYFSGIKFTKAATHPTDALTYLRFNGKGRSKIGIADVNVRLGYCFLEDEDYKVSACFDVVLPTGNEPKAVWLFEPIVGNGGHFGLGGGLRADFNLWRSDDKKGCVDFILCGNVQYLFESTNKRVWGVYNHRLSRLAEAAPYRLAVEKGAKKFAPAASFLAQDSKVTPGITFDGITGINYTNNGFCFDLYYNLFAREADSVKLSNAWTENYYGFADVVADRASTAAVVGKDGDTYNGPIQKEGNKTTGTASNGTALGTSGYNKDLTYYISSLTTATPSALTHKVAIGGGYTFNIKACPVRIGLGGEYELSGGDNDTIDSWGLWTKIGICF